MVSRVYNKKNDVQHFRFYPVIWQFLLALYLSVSPVTAQEPVLPPLVDEIAAQFPAIGLLREAGFRAKRGCTATLIAPDLILTAAHCTSASGHSGSVFVAGWSRGDYIAARGSNKEIRHPAYALDGTHQPQNDIALVMLDSPIEDVMPIPLGEFDYEMLYGTDVAVIGYHHKTPHLLSGRFTCPVMRFSSGLVHIGCPVIGGNSGSPLLRKTRNGGWQVVGVVSSRIGAGAIAVELPDWLRREVTAHLQRKSTCYKVPCQP